MTIAELIEQELEQKDDEERESQPLVVSLDAEGELVVDGGASPTATSAPDDLPIVALLD